MASRRFKFNFILPSFQFCRSKRTSSNFPKCPTPAPTSLFFPVNPKSFEIAYPTFPDPPPSTPNHRSSKVIPLDFQIMHNSPSSFDSDTKSPIKPENNKDNRRTSNSKSKPKRKSKSKAKVSSISSGHSVWFSSEDEKEFESTFSSSTSLDSSLDTINESDDIKNKITKNKKNKVNLRGRRLRRYVSYSCKTAADEHENGVGEGKVKDSFAVVKRSEDPYEDFKRSMLEMILEKQMFEAEELEKLLQCFLSLNSRQHHSVIVKAFSEIWAHLFL